LLIEIDEFKLVEELQYEPYGVYWQGLAELLQAEVEERQN
jgi:hypothetical protein